MELSLILSRERGGVKGQCNFVQEIVIRISTVSISRRWR
jgi:hypothetical protein